MKKTKTVNDRPPNFRLDEDGRLFLVRCFACGGDRGKENWAAAVATGQCCWCGWSETVGAETAAPVLANKLVSKEGFILTEKDQ